MTWKRSLGGVETRRVFKTRNNGGGKTDSLEYGYRDIRSEQ